MTSQDWWREVLSRNRLSQPDGRPIYRYVITGQELTEAKRLLQKNAASISQGLAAPPLCAVFVCYCAEIFKLESDRGIREWEPLLKPLRIALAANERGRVVEPGLRYLKQRVVKRSGELRTRREWLLTIALQAGLPVKLLVRSEGHWLKDYLNAVLIAAFQSADLTQSLALDLAESEQERLTASYKDPDFFELVADLAMALKGLRDKAPGQIANSNALVDWLERNEPRWRDSLPMHLGDDATRSALTGLVREAHEAAIKNTSPGRLAVQREIYHDGTSWVPAVRLEVGGSVPLQNAKPDLGRLELHARDSAARHIGSALAVILPPAARAESWVLKSNLRDPLIRNFPLETPVLLEARGPALLTSQAISAADGDGLFGEVLVFEPVGDPATCTRAIYIGSGTSASRSDTLIALVPKDAEVRPVDSGAAEAHSKRGCLGDRFDVIEVRASVRVTVRGSGNVYRLDPGTDGVRRRLQLASCRTVGWEPLSKSILVTDSLASLSIHDGGKRRAPLGREIEWRADGTGPWQCVLASRPRIGRFRLRWRDNKADVTLDSISVCLVPPGLAIKARHDGTRLSIAEPDIADVSVRLDGDSVRRSGKDWEFTNGPRALVTGSLKVGKHELDISIPVRPARNIFVDVNGSAIRSGTCYLWQLAGCEAIAADSREQVIIRLVSENDSERLEQFLAFPREGERQIISFVQLEAVMEQLWAAKGSLDCEIQLSFSNQAEPLIKVRLFEEQLPAQNNRIDYDLDSAARLGRRLAFRSLIEPDRELAALEEHSLLVNSVPTVFPPPDLTYPALVYDRTDGRVYSRPRLLLSDGSRDDLSGLSGVLAITDVRERQKRLAKWFEDRPLQDSGQSIGRAAASLDGLPAIALDFLKFAPEPALAAALLWSKDAQTEAAVWSLERQLPFSWLLCRRDAWDQAITEFGYDLYEKLAEVFEKPKAAEYARQSVRSKLDALVQREACLASVFHLIPNGRQPGQPVRTADLSEAWGQLQDALHRSAGDSANADTLKAPRAIVERGIEYILGRREPLRVQDRIELHRLRQRFPREFEVFFGALLTQHAETGYAKRS